LRISLRYTAARRYIVPIYGLDQLVFVAVLAVFTLLLAEVIHDSRAFFYLFFGGYFGYVTTMLRSSPAFLDLSETELVTVRDMLESSHYLHRVKEDHWRRNVDRFRRWSSDDLQLIRIGIHWRLQGRLVDLQVVANNMGIC
jgi:hypothetical protein